jgi:predicted dehydrogenase
MQNRQPSRRELIRTTGRVAAASALAGVAIPSVHAASSDLIQVALVGCGGRGTGAAANALAAKGGPIKLVAMADVFTDRLGASHKNLSTDDKFTSQVEVPEERRFIGFDAYRKALDCLQPGDVAIFATPPAFRWVHFKYAIEKGLNVFMEKPITVDGPTSKRMFELAEEASKKNLKCGVGLMSRHSRGLQQLVDKVRDGWIGDIILQRGYRMHPPGGSFHSIAPGEDQKELDYQIRRFHSFLWASGGNFSDFYIHVIDHLGWLKGEWPVKAQAIGGRHYKLNPDGQPWVDQNFDIYGVEYTYADGSKFNFDGRCMDGCENFYASYLHGTKGSAIASRAGDCGQPSAIFRTQSLKRGDQIWESKAPEGEGDPYTNEWDDLIDAIRKDKPYNEVPRGVEASLVTSMGRMAAHTGQEITYEQMLNCEHEFAPGVADLTADSPAPIQMGPDKRYPVPQPGINKDREY